MVKYVLAVFAVSLLVLAPVALADWDESIPAKWVQMPDETELGIDVNASYGLILADDFLCTETGPITGIHIWGSWLYDILPMGRPDSCTFVLSLHYDIPDSESSTGYSMPGDVIVYKIFRPGDYTARIWTQGIQEGWMDPPDNYFWPADQVIWQYNFPILDGEFFQEGTVDSPIVYWLDVKAIPWDDQARFGWKTARDHWNDDAVWGQGDEPYYGPWGELRYPPGHEMAGQSIDLAFVIVGEEEPQDVDWGDAPEFPDGSGYPTTSLSLGANHTIGGPYLGVVGDQPDPEADGQPDWAAMGDDMNGVDDENGVQIPPLQIGFTSTITYQVRGGGGFVAGWIDWNSDHQWTAGELVVTGWHAAGDYAVNVTPPAASVVGQTFSRWRISTVGGMTPTGNWPDGEVEDHEVFIEETMSKWIQHPDLDVTGIDVECTEPLILADDFECTESGRIIQVMIWGSWLDDYIPFNEDAGLIDFTLSFHEDIPADESPTGYSMPADPVWWRDFVPGEFSYGVYASNLEEGWMYPPDSSYIWPADFTCWYYKFDIPVEEAFFQRGSANAPRVYWLDVQARPHDVDAKFGWKTSLEHWNDDAVWGAGPEPYLGPWYELRYPDGHNMEGESIDLAFMIVTDPMSKVPSDDRAPEGLGLFQNVPNPFTGSTTIRYALPGAAHVKVEVFDVEGRLVSVLVDGTQAAGPQSVVWEGTDSKGNELPSGVYFYRVSTAREARTMKMLLLR